LRSIRAVTVTMAPTLRDLVAGLVAGRGCVDVTAELKTRDDLQQRLQALAPRLVLVGLAKNEGDEVAAVLADRLPSTRVIAFSNDGRHAFVHQRGADRRILLEMSARQLIDAILGA
jgi:hypothetical protein